MIFPIATASQAAATVPNSWLVEVEGAGHVSQGARAVQGLGSAGGCRFILRKVAQVMPVALAPQHDHSAQGRGTQAAANVAPGRAWGAGTPPPLTLPTNLGLLCLQCVMCADAVGFAQKVLQFLNANERQVGTPGV